MNAPPLLSGRHRRSNLLLLLAFVGLIAFSAAWAATADFSGAWRLDDLHSDSAGVLTTLLRAEARREQPAALPSTAHTAAPGSTTAAAGHTGRHGGGMDGRGAGMGGHGGHHGSRGSASAHPDTDQDPLAHAQFALPPLLDADSVLLVQQQTGSLQIQLDNGEQLKVRLDGQPRQSLNGEAMVQGNLAENGVQIIIRYADGRQLEQDWIRTADGRQLTIHGLWKLPSLQEPVPFHRSYLAVG